MLIALAYADIMVTGVKFTIFFECKGLIVMM